MTAGAMELFSYFRSSAAFRCRIALGLKGLSYETLPVHLRRGGGVQHGAAFSSMNPEKLVPVLKTHDGALLTQSLAILEYLEEEYPDPPLLPKSALDRAWVRALASHVACDVHPLNNLRVLHYLQGTLAVSESQKNDWMKHWIDIGFSAVEQRLVNDGHSGSCCFGDQPGLADCCLIPQVANSRRLGIALDAFPSIVRIETHLMRSGIFQQASPDAQVDAE